MKNAVKVLSILLMIVLTSSILFTNVAFAQILPINDLQAVERNATSIKLHWTPMNSSDVARYRVFRADLGNDPSNITAFYKKIEYTAGKKGYFTDLKLNPSSSSYIQYYKYKVQALNSADAVIGESNELVVSTTDTNKIKTNFKMLVLSFDPRMSTSVPASYSNDSEAVSHYNTYFAGKLQSELSGDVVHSRAKAMDPDGCADIISNLFYWSSIPHKNLKNNNFIKQLKNFFKTASLGSFSFDVYNDSVITINSYPLAKDPNFQQSDATVFELAYDPKPCSTKGCPHHEGQCLSIQYDIHNHGSIDYEKLVTTPYQELQGNTIVDLIEEGTIDGVWVMAGPVLSGFRENALMAKDYFGFSISASPDCSRDFFVNGMSASPSAFDGYVHMFEGMLNERSRRNPDNWPLEYTYSVYDDPNDPNITKNMNVNLVGRFFMTDGANYNMSGVENTCRASKGSGNVGTSHYPPTSIFGAGDYQYSNENTMKTYVKTCADDWFLYPNLPTAPNYRMMNSYDYGAFNEYTKGADVNDPNSYRMIIHTSMYHQWWFNHIPHNPGVSNEKLNNWWPYIFDINNFKGEVINYNVTGFPEIPTSFEKVNGEIGTDSSVDYWGYWHSFNEEGRNADITSISKTDDSSNVISGDKSVKVNVNEVSWNNDGRNDVYYPITKNAKWDLSSAKNLNMSVKFLNNADIVANGGTNPVIRLYKNGGTRIEYVYTENGRYANKFAGVQNNTWVDISVPLSGNPNWKKVVIGYVEPSLTGEAREAELKKIEDSVLSEVNYIEVSIDAATTSTESTFSFIIDNLHTTDGATQGDTTVENLWLLGTDNKAKILWDAVSGASSYTVELTAPSGVTTFNVGNVTEYLFDNIITYNNYSVRVRAEMGSVSGEWSRSVTFQTMQNFSNTMNWTMVFPQSGDYYNKFEYVDTATGVWSFPKDNTATDGVMTIGGLSPDTEYMGCLTYYNQEESCYKQIHLHEKTLYNKVENVWLLGTSNKAKIQWDAVPGATTYKVELTGPSGVNVFDVGNVTEYLNENIITDKNYSVRVRAEASDKVGEWSRVISFQTKGNTSTSMNWTMVFPQPGEFYNKFEYVDTATGVWSFPITNNACDCTTTIVGLASNREYMGCLTYYNQKESCYKQIHLYANTLQ